MSRRAVLALLLAALLPGCGGEGERPSPGAAAREPKALDPHLVAALGDSITAGSPRWDPDPAVRARISATTGAPADPRSQWEHFYEQAHPGVRVRNCGLFGERTDGIAVRLAACADGAAALVIQGGINDIAQGRPVEDAARDLEAMVRAGKRGGRTVVVVEVLPWNNGYPAAAPRIDDLNRRIRALSRREDVRVLGWHGALEDPRRPGRMRADLTIDGDHPSVEGYRRLAALVRLP